MSSINPKDIIKNKLENIKNLITEYEKITNKDKAQKYEVLIDDHVKQIEYEIKYEFKRYEPLKLISLRRKYEEIKKKKQFLNFQCVRCSSQENMTYYPLTRKMASKSKFISATPRELKYRTAFQVFNLDFPVCSACRKKIKILKTINFWTLLILIGWIVSFGGMGIYLLWLYGASLSTNSVLPMIYIIIAVVGGLGFLIGKIGLRFLKYWPRRFIKIKVKYLGHTAPMKGKNYEGIPMVKPLTSKKWISYDTWLKSL